MTKILVIEDEEPLREEILEWLGFEDFEAFGASDGVEGVEAALRIIPDLIVCDIMMPRLDGYGTLLELRTDLSTASIPFIFLTARADRESVRYGMELGADDYLTKPFTRQELFQAIRTRLDKRAVQDREFIQQIDNLHEAINQEREQRILKSRLVSMFSHDFRNSLAAILSSNSLLRDYSERMTAERRQTHMNQIEASVRLLLHMLDEMILAGQIETDNLSAHLENFDLIQFMNNIVKEFRLIDNDEHPILFDFAQDIRVRLDKNLIRRLVANLLSNALKYSSPGSEINVRVQQDKDDIVLSIRDHGIGIPEADLEHLFEAFHRASNVESVEGTGLGLAIVRRVVDLHNGTIHIESQVGAGSTFIVTLPCQPKGI